LNQSLRHGGRGGLVVLWPWDKRVQGRPRRRWTDDVKDWSKKSIAECRLLARDRNAQRELLSSSLVDGPQSWDGLGIRQGKALRLSKISGLWPIWRM